MIDLFKLYLLFIGLYGGRISRLDQMVEVQITKK